MRNNQRKKKILVIDDDELYLYTSRELLQDEDCEVITHKSNFGIGVTSLVKELRPDLILLDVNMPGLSGDKLAKLLRWRNAPFIFYSSNDEDNLREIASLYGAKGYICKGDIVELKNLVRKYLPMTTHEDCNVVL